MLYNTTITKKWQMTIPKEVRHKINILKPGKLILQVNKDNNNDFLIKIIKSPDDSHNISELNGILNKSYKKLNPILRQKINKLDPRSIFEKNYQRV